MRKLMKRYIILVLILVLMCICTTYAKNQDAFINALRNCTPYNASGDMVINGVATSTTKQMQGWNNGKCTYKETLIFNGQQITTVCRFSKPQIQEIVSVADAFDITQKYTEEDIDLSSTEAVKNNPVAKVLGKYLQDPDVCTISGMD